MNIEVFKLTDDDWCPSFGTEELNLVLVSFDRLDDGTWRVSAWGDDCGCEKDFESEAVAFNLFLQSIGGKQ